MKNNTLSYRVGELEKKVGDIGEKLDKIRTNELPHIQEELSSLKTRITLMTALNIGAIVFGIIISKML